MSRALALVDSDESRKYQSPGAAPKLLETKFYVPRARFDVIPRLRLIDEIRRGTGQKLTIVVAPAGFGKTTLVSTWLAASANALFAWLSLDASENDPIAFWTYVVSALQRIRPSIGVDAIAQLRSAEPPPIESVLTTVMNEIDAIEEDLTLVLDDYHVIEADSIHATMTFLLDRLPRRMRIVITSRSQPPLSLPRLRARGELTELGPADLRFTLDEASAFLRSMSLELSADDTAKLEQRTEGWIAGLKLAALSIKGRADTRGFVDAFSGDSRHIADYLVEEVMRSESEQIRRFLLRTSILERLSASVCDAVTEESRGQAILEDLERRSLFVVPLDDRREWYRYHHLFADVLRKQLSAADPNDARLLHRRASEWHERYGTRADAIRHAFAADDLPRAAGILEREWPNKDRSYETRQWLDQVKRLPDAVVRARPVLRMGFAWGLLNSGELEAAEPWLHAVESWLEPREPHDAEQTSARMVVTDEKRFQSLAAELAAARVYLSQSQGGAPGTLEHAQRALDLTPPGDDIGRASATALVSLALWGRGDLEAAHRTFSDALAIMQSCGHALDAIRGIFVLGDIRAAQGRLREAAKIYERGLRLAADGEFAVAPETDELNLGLSEVYLERNDLGAAIGSLNAVEASRARTAYVGNRLRCCTAMAGIRVVQGNLDGALALLDEAEQHERRDPVPRARPIPAMRARIRIMQGKLDDAAAWAVLAKVSVDDELPYLREFEHITLARMLIALHSSRRDERSLHDAVRLLERLHTAALTGGRIGSVIEISVLEAVTQHALGNLRGALDHLGDAMALAEPEGFLRIFLDHGTRVRDLVRHSIARGLSHPYSRVVLAAFDGPKQVAVPTAAVAPPSATAPADASDLTTRELEILRLIGAGLRNQEIADHLSISAATVKRHIANAYGKLGAGHRTEALVRAKELKLL